MSFVRALSRAHSALSIGLAGKGGKAAALKDAMELVITEVILIFDADYIPGRRADQAAGCAVLRSRSRRRHGPGRAYECRARIC